MTKAIKVHASIQARAGVTIGNDTGALPANPVPNTMWASGKDLLLSCIINGVQTWFPLVRGSDFAAYMHTQASPNNQWTVNHNLNSDGLWVQVVDGNGNIVQTLTDYTPSPADPLNSFTLSFALPINGHAFVVGNKVLSAALVNATELNIADRIQLSSAGFTIDGNVIDLSTLKDVATLSQSVTDEVNRAIAAENGIANNLNSEVTRAQLAEAALQASLSAETTRASGVEGNLATLISQMGNNNSIESISVTYTCGATGNSAISSFVAGVLRDGRTVAAGDTLHNRGNGDIYTVQASGAPVLTNAHQKGIRLVQSSYSAAEVYVGPLVAWQGTFLYAKDYNGNALASVQMGTTSGSGIWYRNLTTNESISVTAKLAQMGVLANLTTTTQSDLVAAINELVTNIGNVSNTTTKAAILATLGAVALTGSNTGDETQATILSKLSLTSISGVNTGDETAATIKTKLGITTLSGSNTGDETQSSILTKLGATTVTGSNTGDETLASLKTKLGITTLSGSNTGDETQSSILSKLGLTAISGSNTGDQTITLTGDVTGSGTGTFSATIAANSVTLGKMATMATASLLGRNTAGTGNPEVLAPATVLTMLGLNNVNNTSDANKPVSTAQAAANATTLASAKSYADGLVVGLWDDRGNYDASVNTFPTSGGSGTAGAVLKGDIWTVSVAGTVGGTPVAVRQTLRAMVDAPGQTATNWAISLASTDIDDSITAGVTGRAPSQNAVSVALANEVTARNAAIAATSTGTNTGDETGATIRTKLGITTLSGSNTGDETNATILSKLGVTSISGVNTGDETATTIKTKLGISTLSGANTGDETQASLLSKLGAAAVTGSNTGDETQTTILNKLNITSISGVNTGDETNTTILTKLNIPSISGTNTGDETAATIKAKLGITTLSGANTGDETQASLLSKLGNTVVTPSTFNSLTPYDISTFGIGKPAVNDTMLAMVMTRPMSLPVSLTGSVAKCTAAPTAAITFNILKNGASIGSINFAAAATAGTFTFTTATSFGSGDILTIVAPATQDATFAGLLATLVAILN